MWIEIIQSLTDDVTFDAPASAIAVADCESALGHPLPGPLTALLRETNGVVGEYGLGLIWPVERIQKDNLEFRRSSDLAELYMPFDPLLFFADAGNGDQFAFVMRNRPDDVFVRDHESDSRTWIADGLEQYLRGWLTGSLQV
jgi:hypothetical protein